ncbi:MAG TPA: ester cyclase [Thermomicrobiales bacterium]|nr:ester cyclase [Thermomicrobiales bacterium]
MSAEESKNAVRRLFDEVWNERKLDAVTDVLVADYAQRERSWAEMVLAAFPDTHFTIDDMLAEDDRVATRVTWRATHEGEFAGIAPTGRQIEMSAMFIHRMGNGKAIESWGFGDAIGIFDQIKAAIGGD